MRRLIVNADDFGLSETVDLGIIKGHREGIVTSTTLLACGGAAKHAARLASENPSLGVGVHLCLTLERPVLDPARIPSITRNGRLLGSPFDFMRRLTFGRIEMAEVEAELRAQIERAIALGIRPTHIDSHQHLHVMPGILPIVLRLAQEYEIPAMRFPIGPWVMVAHPARIMEKIFLEGFSNYQKGRIKSSGIKRPDFFFGLAQTGRLSTESLIRIIEALPEGTSEVMCHPGLNAEPGMDRDTELGAVTDEGVKALISDRSVGLISFKDLIN